MDEQVKHYMRTVEQALRQSELRFERIATDVFRLSFSGHNLKDIVVCVTANDQWVRLLCLFSGVMEWGRPRVREWMLRQNHVNPAVKFCLSAENEVLLQADLAVESLDLRTFQTALQALVITADGLYSEYQALLGQ
jgi:hypothetical protein